MSVLIVVAAILTQQAQPSTVPMPAKQRPICKRTVETGSLVRGRRECRTSAEWDRIAEAARAGGQNMVDRNASGIVTN